MISLRPLLSCFTALGFAGGALGDESAVDPRADPTGLWKGFTIYDGQVLAMHPIFALDYKDGKLTGRQITVDRNNSEDDRPLLSPKFKDGVVSFDVMLPAVTRHVGFSRQQDGGSGMGGAGGGSSARDPLKQGRPSSPPPQSRLGQNSSVMATLNRASDVSAGSSGATVSYVGRLLGETIIGTHTKQTNGGRNGPDIIEAHWAAARITPAGVWDLAMHDLTLDGKPADRKDPLRSVSDEFMRFDYANLTVSGGWKRDPGKLVPINSVRFTSDGIAFTATVWKPGGKIVYAFTGSFIGTIADDAIANDVAAMPKLVFDHNSARIENAGALLDLISGTVKIAAPDGQVYRAKWRLTRDDGKHARVEVGVPYEVQSPAPTQP